MSRYNSEIFVDNFAGGGGASTGIELAIGRSVDIAINHDEGAIAMHKVNHPDSEHYCESVWDVDPVEACKGRPVALAWFSPDCKHFSKAKGGKPVEKEIRGLAWIAVKWAEAVKPRVIMLENVEEFKTWGPLTEDNRPDPKRKGETFELFKAKLRKLGYEVDHRELRACDYGAPTIRKRLFMVARCDGKPIVWPEATHGKPGTLEVEAGLQKPYLTAAEIIDWDLPCPSIFDRKKPLAENTLKRIARGIKRFVVDNPDPFIVRIGHTGFGGDRLQYSLEKPLTTVTSKAEHCLVAPTLIQMGYGDPEGKRVLNFHRPMGTVTALGNKFATVSTFLAKHYGGNYTGAGSSIDDPIHTITAADHNALVTSHLIKFRGTCKDGQKVDEPIPTLTAGGTHVGEVRAFLMAYYGASVGGKCDDPLQTITSRDRFGLVTVKGVEYQIVDIGMRMLQPHELFAGQGFPKDYVIDKDIDGNKITKTEQVKRCGNAVPPPFAEALVRANLIEHCKTEMEEAV